MSRYFTVSVNSGTSPGPYAIYYDIVNDGNITFIMDTTIPASGLTLSQLGFGVTVTVPDTATTIILYNILCDTFETYIISPKLPDYPCICINIDYIDKFEQFEFCPNGVIENNKPVYQTTSTQFLKWNTNGYWQFEGHPQNYIFRTNFTSNIPTTGWFGVGVIPSNTITATEGKCVENTLPSNLKVEIYNPSCSNQNDGTINALATGGQGGWTYSIDGINFTNQIGLFTSLPEGLYTVYAKDSGDTIITETVTLVASANTSFNIVGSYNITNLPTAGNMKYYMATINYNTNNIPVGETVTFDLNIIYNLSYSEPGGVIFDTSQQYITINSNPIPINSVNITVFSVNGTSSCNSIYNTYVSDKTCKTNIVLTKGDTFVVNVTWGIDTKTNGVLDLPCYTTGQVGVELFFENVKISCDCCSLLGNLINISQPIQIYQP